MKIFSSFTVIALAAVMFTACGPKKADDPLADTGRTQRTENLLANMKAQADSAGYMYGHQDDTAYGIGWMGDSCRSDVNSVCNDFPAVVGFDLGHIELGDSCNLDGVPFDHMRQLIFDQYNRNGVVTISWHVNNPYTRGTAWVNDSVPAEKRTMKAVTRPGKAHDYLCAYIDSVAKFLNSLETPYGVKVPVIFRPWHEQTGSWFWWGKDYCTPDEYRQLWQMVVDRFKENDVTNALLAYSPGSCDEKEYMERYPGDDIIDVMGLDNYCYVKDQNDTEGFTNYITSVHSQLEFICRLARDHGKVAAFTETGYECIPQEKWWTETLAPAIGDLPIAYVLTWRNANNREHHFFAPYPGQISVTDFVTFYNLPRTLFDHDINGIYLQKGKKQ